MPTRAPEMATPTHRATEDDLRATPRDGQKYELVDGEIVVSPAGTRHGTVCVNLLLLLGNFVRGRNLGQVLESSTGFRLPGGNVRSPDVSFIARDRLAGEPLSDDFSNLPPDLAVEVLSPNDRTRELMDKIGEYLQAGVRMVWVVDPKRERGAVYRSLTDVRELGPDGTFDGEDVVPGFACRLRDILE